MQRRHGGGAEKISGEAESKFSAAGGYDFRSGGSLRGAADEEFSGKDFSGNREDDILDWARRNHPKDLAQRDAEGTRGGSACRGPRGGVVSRLHRDAERFVFLFDIGVVDQSSGAGLYGDQRVTIST